MNLLLITCRTTLSSPNHRYFVIAAANLVEKKKSKIYQVEELIFFDNAKSFNLVNFLLSAGFFIWRIDQVLITYK